MDLDLARDETLLREEASDALSEESERQLPLLFY
jgi:hypothetical protein